MYADFYIEKSARVHIFLCKNIESNLEWVYMQQAETGKSGINYIKNATFAVRNWLAQISNTKRTELISHYTYHCYKRCKYGLPAECFDSFIDLDFEGYKVRAFEKYDLYLSKLYGDYMTLPPEDKRVSDVYYSDLKLIDVDVELLEDEKHRQI